MAQVKFGRGSKTHEQYKTSIEGGYTYDSNMIYFNTTTNQIYLGDSVFGVSASDANKFNNAFEAVSYDSANHTITFTQHDGTTDQTVLIPLSSASVAGLMSPAQYTAVETTFPTALNTLMGESNVEGSVKKALADAKSYADEKVNALDLDEVKSTVGQPIVSVSQADGKVSASFGNIKASSVEITDSNNKITADNVEAALAEIVNRIETLDTSAAGVDNKIKTAIEALDADKSNTSTDGHVTVQVVEVDGKIDSVAVTTSDIASANTLSNLSDKVGTVAEGKTVVGMIEEAKAEAKTEIAAKATGHVTVSSEVAEDGHVVYTISEADIASADELDALELSVGAANDEADAAGSVYARIAALSAEDVDLGARLDALEGEEGALATAKKYTDDEIAKLDATVGSQAIAEGKHIAVEVVEANGVLTTLTVVENDIASAATLAAVKEDVDAFFKDASFAEAAKDTLKELQDYIDSDVQGAAAMSKSIADNKAAIEKEVKDRADAIGALNAEKTGDGTHVDVTVKQVAGVITEVSVSESDIASATALKSLSDAVGTSTDGVETTTVYGAIAAEKKAREDGDKAINETIGTVAEGKTVVGMIEDAQKAAVAAGTVVAEGTDEGNHLSIVESTNADNSKTYTISLADVASANSLSDLSNKVGTVKNGTISQDIVDAQTAAQNYADNSVKALKENEVKANADALATLNGGEDVTGSVAKAAKDTLTSAQNYTDTALTWYEG